jgi:antitoxin component of RelBE/YafQ-DinJ toxin-antitoxin module
VALDQSLVQALQVVQAVAVAEQVQMLVQQIAVARELPIKVLTAVKELVRHNTAQAVAVAQVRQV